MTGNVLVNSRIIDKPGTLVQVDARIELQEPAKYVSRGGIKLEKALQAFKLAVRGKTAVDVGASTGGFTDCLLQHGARKVFAVDVGKGQLDWKLRNDPRVIALEGVNARYLKPEDIGEQVDLATVDVSFISLKKILPSLKELVKPGGDLVALVKPQFEAGRSKVKKGIVKDPAVHIEVLSDLSRFINQELGLSVLEATFSPLLGPEGNIEFFLYLENFSSRSRDVDLEMIVRNAHKELG